MVINQDEGIMSTYYGIKQYNFEPYFFWQRALTVKHQTVIVTCPLIRLNMKFRNCRILNGKFILTSYNILKTCKMMIQIPTLCFLTLSLSKVQYPLNNLIKIKQTILNWKNIFKYYFLLIYNKTFWMHTFNFSCHSIIT